MNMGHSTRPPGYEVTHFLQAKPAACRVALCGRPDPALDLRPVAGDINCGDCRALWNAGYRGPHTKRWPPGRRGMLLLVRRLRAVAEGQTHEASE
jgi:hypothetical protein